MMTDFTYPSNARELPRRQSPLWAWYQGQPAGTYLSRCGVVTTNKPIQEPVEEPTRQ
jgi:hypothetical protein